MYFLKRLVWTAVIEYSKKGRARCLLRNSRCFSSMEMPPAELASKPETQTRLQPQKLVIPEGIMGQPTCHTHPHMVQEGNLTCCVTQQEYIDRRDRLVTQLVQEVENVQTNHVIVIPGAVKQFMSDKIPYVFRQNSDFFYLTGCLEPGAILVMLKSADKDCYTATLFVTEKDPYTEMWEGPCTGTSAASRLFAVNEARPIETFNTFLQSITKSKPCMLWYQMDNAANKDLNPTISSLMHKEGGIRWSDPQKAIHSLRVLKSPAEIELMKDTCFIGAQSVNMAMACTKPGISEHTVSAVLDFTCKQGGAEHLAFPPVVAGGPRAVHIHYVTNNQLLEADQMLLVDTGCQRWLYNSDLSRTWPVSGKFTPYQRILYELVLSVQKKLIELMCEQRRPLDHLFNQMCKLLGTHMQEEGILPKNIDGNELIASAYRLCPHHVSHYLGLDVHDSPLIRRSIPLQTGMVVTVEPGLYIQPNDKSVPEEFRGMGIRVEDDVLITDSAPCILTEAAVKEVSDIESIVGKHIDCI